MHARLNHLKASGKATAFAVHLGLSACAVAVLAALMVGVWYPPPYFMLDGGWQVLRLILLVDVVLGPLMTLIVFDRAKKELKRDLAVIVALQLAAFAYGAWVMHAYRPAFLVFAESAFYTANWRDIRRATPDASLAEALAARAPAPLPVYLELPADRRQRARLFEAMTAGGPAVTHYGNLYRRLDTFNFERIARGAVDIDVLARGDPTIAAELARVRAAQSGRQLAFIALNCRYGMVMLVFDRASLAIVDSMN